MIAAFARNESAAQVIGTTTPGEVVGDPNFQVGSDYLLRLPVTAWYTASDESIKGKIIQPQPEHSDSFESLKLARDIPMEAALHSLS